MKKSTKIIITLLCIFVVALTLYLVYDMQNKLSQKASTNSINNNTTNSNTVNMDNNTNNVITNTVTEENNVEDNKEVDNEPEDNNIDVSLKEEEYKRLAIKLVKEKWGEDSTIYFTNEGKNDNGEFLVSVRSKDTTSIIANFKVNVFNEEATIDL